MPPTHQTEDLEELELLEDLEQRRDLVERAHKEGHWGAAAMARTIRSSKLVTWPELVRDCQAYVSSCIPCQRYNIGKHGYHPPKNLTALMPFDHLSVDLKEMPMSAKGNCYYLLIIDVATRFLFIRPLMDKSRFSVAQALFRLFCDIGFPKVIQSDNGTEFINEVLSALKKLSRIDERVIAPYHHRAQGIAEKAIHTTSQSIYKSLCGLTSRWDDYAPSVQYFYNVRVSDIHGSSPYALMFARRPNGFIDYTALNLTPEQEEERKNRLLFVNSIVFPTILEKVKGKLAARNE